MVQASCSPCDYVDRQQKLCDLQDFLRCREQPHQTVCEDAAKQTSRDVEQQRDEVRLAYESVRLVLFSGTYQVPAEDLRRPFDRDSELIGILAYRLHVYLG